MKIYSKKFLGSLSIVCLLATTSVQAMNSGDQQSDKSKTPPKQQQHVQTQPDAQPNTASSSSALTSAPSSTSTSSSSDLQKVMVFAPLRNQSHSMGYIQPDLQEGAKLNVTKEIDCWDLTTTGTSNRDENAKNRRQLVAYLETGQGPHKTRYTTLNITGEIEWISGTGPVYFGLVSVETTLLKYMPNGNRAVIGLAPETPNEDLVPETEIAQGRRTYSFNFLIAPGEHDVAFFTGNLADKVARYKIRNLRITGPTEKIIYSHFLDSFLKKAKEDGTLVDDTNRALALAVLQTEHTVLERVQKSYPTLIGHRIHKKKSGDDQKEKSVKGKDDEKKGKDHASAKDRLEKANKSNTLKKLSGNTSNAKKLFEQRAAEEAAKALGNKPKPKSTTTTSSSSSSASASSSSATQTAQVQEGDK